MTIETPAETSVNEASIADLRAALLGTVLTPIDDGYDGARRGLERRHRSLPGTDRPLPRRR